MTLNTTDYLEYYLTLVVDSFPKLGHFGRRSR